MKSDVVFSHKSDEWSTPDDLYRELDAEFGFTLDPCATVENHKCEKFHTVSDNGLLEDWGGQTVFCNPPYSRIGEWVKKCAHEGKKTTVVMLIPSRTDTKWFHEYIYSKTEIRFIKGRLKFGNSKNGAPFPSMIVIWRGNENYQYTYRENICG